MHTHTSNHQALKLPQVMERTTLSRATVWRFCKAGTFPKPFNLGGGHAVAWLERDINAWLEAQAGNSGA
jgi:prophage regulatory protein